MARQQNLLKATQVAAAKTPGRLADGNGLFLLVGAGKAKSWAFVSRKGGRWREMGLGGYPTVTLEAARARANSLREQIAAGEDPFAKRRPFDDVTFGTFVDANISEFTEDFRNAKHRQQWANTLSDNYVASLRRIPIAEVTAEDVAAALEPHWVATPETADRLRARIEYVLDAAKARNLREGENPATGRRFFAMKLTKRPRRTVRNHPAMRWRDLPAFWPRLRALDSVSANALAFLILTAARSGEVMGATWDEIDGDAWRVPGSRMKAGEDHDVPLTKPALAILERMKRDRRYRTAAGDFIFPGAKRDSKLSVMALAMCLRGLDPSGSTPHGMRAAFRTWAAEKTNYPREVVEQALAHTVAGKVERAYLRTKFFPQRQELMRDWAKFLESGSA